jgi:ribonuclease HI
MESMDTRTERFGAEPHTTNNRMELTAVISALETVQESYGDGATVRVVTDSQYVKNGITTWVHSWLRNGWKTAAKKPVKNQDLWIRLHELNTRLSVEWAWVRGHSGHEENERCDLLVQQAIATVEST